MEWLSSSSVSVPLLVTDVEEANVDCVVVVGKNVTPDSAVGFVVEVEYVVRTPVVGIAVVDVDVVIEWIDEVLVVISSVAELADVGGEVIGFAVVDAEVTTVVDVCRVGNSVVEAGVVTVAVAGCVPLGQREVVVGLGP